MEYSISCTKWIKDNLLLLLALVGVAVGFGLAFALMPFIDPQLDSDIIMWIGLPGELFLRGLQCTIIPVVTSSVIVAVSTLDIRSNSRMGGMTLIYIFSVVLLAVSTGLTLSLLIEPGNIDGDAQDNENYAPTFYDTQDVFADLFRNLISDNIVLSCISSVFTEYETKDVNGTITIISKSTADSSGTNLLGILTFSVAFGMAMNVEPEKTEVMLKFFMSLRVIIFKVLSIYLWTLPIGTVSLIAEAMLQIEDIGQVFISLGIFTATVIGALAIHAFITLPLIYLIFTRRNPYKYYAGLVPAIITATVAKSGAAAMPEMFRCCEVKRHVNKHVSSFVIPLSTIFNGDGPSIFIISGSLWLAQSSGVDLTAGEIVTMGIIAAAMCMCLPSVPSASLVAIVTVCSAAGVPTENIGLLVTMEWLLDSLRTGVNAISHMNCAGIVDVRMIKYLPPESEDGGSINFKEDREKLNDDLEIGVEMSNINESRDFKKEQDVLNSYDNTLLEGDISSTNTSEGNDINTHF